MSFQAMAWASEQTTGSASRKAVLYALANHANKTGHCRLRIETICAEAELGTTAVKNALSQLAEDGFIERERQRVDGRLGCYDFQLRLETPRDSLGTESVPSQETPGVSQEPVRPFEPKDLSPLPPPPLPKKVDRIPVSEPEATLAVAVLATYNELTGQSFSGRDWLAKIVMRIREHPELDVDAHHRVLEVALANPWWNGRPAPNVVYGNSALFERCLDAALAAPLRNGAGTPQSGRKFGRRDVSSGEFQSLAARLKAESEREERRELEAG